MLARTTLRRRVLIETRVSWSSLAKKKKKSITLTEFPAPPPAGSRTPSNAPKSAPQSAVKARDPLEVVREAIGELDFIGSSQTAAAVCCAALRLGLGARAAVIHAHDPRTREMRVVAANGVGGDALAGMKTKVDDDVIASIVVESAAPMTLAIDPSVGLPRHAPERLKTIGATRSVVAVPAIVKNRVVAIVEVVDPTENPANDAATQYAAMQLATFLESKTKR